MGYFKLQKDEGKADEWGAQSCPAALASHSCALLQKGHVG